MKIVRNISRWKYLGSLLLCVSALHAQSLSAGVDVTVKLLMQPSQTSMGSKRSSDLSNIVVWLSPMQPVPSPEPVAHPPYRLVQKDKMFTPHLLVVPTGTSVEFPNLDPFFHNVFSLFNGKRFDLGLYEAGTHRYVRFDREGVSYIFCNIHPEMSAVILALSTPYYAISTPEGALTLHDVPPGSYRLHIWSEDAQPVAGIQSKGVQSKVVQVGTENLRLDDILLSRAPSPLVNHKNKFGEDYPVTPPAQY
jgi:plastocyanin